MDGSVYFLIFVLAWMGGFGIGYTSRNYFDEDIKINEAKIAHCELELKRTEKCTLVAVPAD